MATADFSRGSRKEFADGDENGEISFFPFETKKSTGFCYKINR